MKIIDLLNKIANGEEVPKKIVHHSLTGDMTWEFEDNCQVEYGYKMTCFCDKVSLNDEVEIIEEEKKIPEKLGLINYCEDQATSLIHHKVDEIIDYLDYLNSKGDE